MMTPVLIIAYNRPDKFEKVLKSLLNCKESRETVLYISIDGPKKTRLTDEKMREEIIEIANSMGEYFSDIILNVESGNLGLANHIVKAINWAFSFCENLIILEDDIEIVSDSFLHFMNTALNIFNSTDIFQVSAYSYPINSEVVDNISGDIFKVRALSCWGWGTWKSKWECYDSNINKHYDYWSRNDLRKKQFDILGNAYFYDQLKGNYNGDIYSWAVRWYSSWMKCGGFSIFPKFSLVQNIGMDGSGTFTSHSLRYNVKMINYKVENWRISSGESEKLKILFNDYFKNVANIKQKYSWRRAYKFFIFSLKNKLISVIEDVFNKKFEGKKIDNCTIYQPTNLGKNISLHDVTLNSYSYISKNTIISHAVIGKFCSIGPNCIIGWGIHPLNGFSTSPVFYSTLGQAGITLSQINKINERKLIEIGNDVFIGMNVTILDGVTIGNGAVIGAGAVVSKDIPPYAIAAGNPIQILRYRFENEIIRKLEASKWWQYDIDKLEQLEKYFFEVNEVLAKIKSFDD
jgi:acetyltransferase-like isoleucine patch superfamily enzyme